jgi:hypothetical protein
MKKVANPIRHGMVRRGPISSKPNKDQSSSNVEQQTNHQSDSKQVRQ